MASAAKFPIQPVPEGMHEVACCDCPAIWLCGCSPEGVLHGYMARGNQHCPLCRPKYLDQQREAWTKRPLSFSDPSSEPDDSSDPGTWPDGRNLLGMANYQRLRRS